MTISISHGDLPKFLKAGTPLKNVPKEDLLFGDHDDFTGVLFSVQSDGMAEVRLKGPCPNLDDAGACEIYTVRPEACKSFTFASPFCNEIRTTDGLGQFATRQLPLTDITNKKPRN